MGQLFRLVKITCLGKENAEHDLLQLTEESVGQRIAEQTSKPPKQ